MRSQRLNVPRFITTVCLIACVGLTSASADPVVDAAKRKKDAERQRVREHAAIMAERVAILRSEHGDEDADEVERELNLLLHSADEGHQQILDLKRQSVAAHLAGDHEKAAEISRTAEQILKTLDERYGITYWNERETAELAAADLLRKANIKELEEITIDGERTLMMQCNTAHILLFASPIVSLSVDEVYENLIKTLPAGQSRLKLTACSPGYGEVHVFTEKEKFTLTIVVSSELITKNFELTALDPYDVPSALKDIGLLNKDLAAVPYGENGIVLHGEAAAVEEARQAMLKFDQEAAKSSQDDSRTSVPTTAAPASASTEYRQQLETLIAKRSRLLTIHTKNHVAVQTIERQVELIKDALVRFPRGISSPSDSVSTAQARRTADVEALKVLAAENEASTKKIARELKTAQASDANNTEELQELEARLTAHVDMSFRLRITLQRAQLADAEQNLRAARAQIDRRERWSEQIIKRRVAELKGEEE